MKAIYTVIFASAIIFIISIDASAQKTERSQNTRSSASQNRNSIAGVSVDPAIDVPSRIRKNSSISSSSASRGRIAGIAIDPSDPSGNTVYASNAFCGVRSRNNRSQAETVGAAQTITVSAVRGITPSQSLLGVQEQMGQQQTTFTSTSNVVLGNYIGTNKNARSSYGNLTNNGTTTAARRVSADRLPLPTSLCSNEYIKTARWE